MSWLADLSEISKAIVRTVRAPGRPAKITSSRLVEAANGIVPSPFRDRKSADINTVVRLQTPKPFRSSNARFRSAIMLKPGKAFGLADDLECMAIDQICTSRAFGPITLDIREITCLSASKGPLGRSETLDEFAVAECQREIGPATAKQLEACLSYYGVRLTSPFRDDGEQLSAVAWSGGTIYWPNYDGSHHFAAARYIAGVLNQPVPITAPLTSYSIDRNAIATLADEFVTWVMPDHDDTWSFVRMIHQYGMEIGVAAMPLPYHDELLVLIPRHAVGASKIIEIIAASDATPFSVFTNKWLEQQCRAAEKLPTLFAG
jgi:hypothetical protein